MARCWSSLANPQRWPVPSYSDYVRLPDLLAELDAANVLTASPVECAASILRALRSFETACQVSCTCVRPPSPALSGRRVAKISRLLERFQSDLRGESATASPLVISDTRVSGHHDEILFMRVVQISEIFLAHAAQQLEDVVEGRPFDRSGQRVRPSTASSDLDSARWVLTLLLTMQPSSFLEFRLATGASSGVASPAYTRLVRARDACRGANLSAAVDAEGTSELHPVDVAHAKWARLHLTLAQHFLGERAGTGGSAGAGFLATGSRSAAWSGAYRPSGLRG